MLCKYRLACGIPAFECKMNRGSSEFHLRNEREDIQHSYQSDGSNSVTRDQIRSNAFVVAFLSKITASFNDNMAVEVVSFFTVDTYE